MQNFFKPVQILEMKSYLVWYICILSEPNFVYFNFDFLFEDVSEQAFLKCFPSFGDWSHSGYLSNAQSGILLYWL